ncbi:10787_t:CDS:2, partial [Gigaspora rosea]
SITKWDINTSKFEAYFLFDNSFSVDNMKLSDDGVLLFVYGKKIVDNLREEPYPCISIYSADRGIRFTTFIIDAVYLIARDIGARLLVVYHKSYKINKGNYRFSICDPFAQYSPDKLYVKIKDLFKDFDVEFDNNFGNIFENKYIIKYDKIVGFNNSGTLVIKDLIKDLIKDTEPNWISYLRNTLKDSDSIYMSSISEQIIGLINKEATFAIDKKPQYSKHLIVPAIYINASNDKKFLKECDCLDNDDLVMVTALGVLVWTFNTKNYKIELSYCWNDEGNSWDWNRIKKRSYLLPPSSYIGMIRHNFSFSQSESLKDDRYFAHELIEKHINDKFFIILYGQKLIED